MAAARVAENGPAAGPENPGELSKIGRKRQGIDMDEHIKGPDKIDGSRRNGRKASAIADVILHMIETGKAAAAVLKAVGRKVDQHRPAASRQDFGRPAAMAGSNFQNGRSRTEPRSQPVLHYRSLPLGVGNSAEKSLPLGRACESGLPGEPSG